MESEITLEVEYFLEKLFDIFIVLLECLERDQMTYCVIELSMVCD